MKFLLIILMFFITSALVIVSNNDLAFSETESYGEFKELYAEWLNQVYFNGQTITGNAVKLDWLP